MPAMFNASAIRARAEAAVLVARQVGRDAARFRAQAQAGGLQVENKGLQDFVTVADRQAEWTIRDRLLAQFPGDVFMGEEGGGQAAPGGQAGTWVVDPIDGTTNYIRGFRHWGVSIAFIANDRVQIGAIYDATQDKVFHATFGGGAYKNGERIHAAETTDPFGAMAILGHSRRTSFDDYQAIAKRLYEAGMDYRRTGAAAIDLIRVAEGVADLFYERHLNAWDMLAGALIAHESGVRVAMPVLPDLLGDGGPIIAYAPGMEKDCRFLLEIEALPDHFAL